MAPPLLADVAGPEELAPAALLALGERPVTGLDVWTGVGAGLMKSSADGDAGWLAQVRSELLIRRPNHVALQVIDELVPARRASPASRFETLFSFWV